MWPQTILCGLVLDYVELENITYIINGGRFEMFPAKSVESVQVFR